MHDYVVLSPELPRRIYSEMFGLVNSSLDLHNVIPNLVYCALIAVSVKFEEGNDISKPPIPNLIYKLEKLVKPYRLSDKDSFIFNAVSYNFTKFFFKMFLGLE